MLSLSWRYKKEPQVVEGFSRRRRHARVNQTLPGAWERGVTRAVWGENRHPSSQLLENAGARSNKYGSRVASVMSGIHLPDFMPFVTSHLGWSLNRLLDVSFKTAFSRDIRFDMV